MSTYSCTLLLLLVRSHSAETWHLTSPRQAEAKQGDCRLKVLRLVKANRSSIPCGSSTICKSGSNSSSANHFDKQPKIPQGTAQQAVTRGGASLSGARLPICSRRATTSSCCIQLQECIESICVVRSKMYKCISGCLCV